MNIVRMIKEEPIMFIILGLIFRDFAGYAMLFESGNIWIVSDIIGFMLIVLCLVFAPKRQLEGTVSTVFKIFLIWTAFMILRGSIIGNYPLGESPNIMGAIHFMVSSPMSTLGYFIPIIALIPFSFKSLNRFKWIVLSILPVSLYLVFSNTNSIIYSQNVAQYQGYTDLEWRGGAINVRAMIGSFFPVLELIVFMLFCYTYIKTRLKLLIPLGIIVYFLGFVVGGGRGGSIFAFGYILTWLYIMYKFPLRDGLSYRKPKTNTNRIIIPILAMGLGFGVYALITNTDIFDFLFYRLFGDSGRSSMFVENNRSIMTQELITDFNTSPLNWVFGRGINGYYVSHSEYSNGGFRAWMEWGYLYLILKGGVVYLFLYVYLFLHAAKQGFFHSKNILCKAMAFVCLFQVIHLASVHSEPSLLSTYVFPWYCLGALERKRLREMDDSYIYSCFNWKDRSRKHS